MTVLLLFQIALRSRNSAASSIRSALAGTSRAPLRLDEVQMMRPRNANLLDLTGFLVGELTFNPFALKPCPHHNIYIALFNVRDVI